MISPGYYDQINQDSNNLNINKDEINVFVDFFFILYYFLFTNLL